MMFCCLLPLIHVKLETSYIGSSKYIKIWCDWSFLKETAIKIFILLPSDKLQLNDMTLYLKCGLLLKVILN